MSEITNPRELFLHELGDILYVERKLSEEVLPRLIQEVRDDEFKSGLEKHLEQTKQHVSNVEKVFRIFEEQPHEEECIGFEGLKKEHDELRSQASTSLVDIGGLSWRAAVARWSESTDRIWLNMSLGTFVSTSTDRLGGSPRSRNFWIGGIP